MSRILIMSMRATKHIFDQIQDRDLLNHALKEELMVKEFSDGEVAVNPVNSVRGAHVYLFGSNSRGHVEELIMTLDSLQRSSVKSVTLILPYFGYGRQDKRKNTRGSLGAKVMANIIQSFKVVERVVTVDIHADQVRGFFDIPVENVEGHSIFTDALKSIVTPNMVVTPPDAGGSERARQVAQKLGLKMVQLDKHREVPNEVASMVLIGDVKGKDVLIVDDMGDTLGTMVKAVATLRENGAENVYIAFTHPVLSGKAVERMRTELNATYVFLSDTINNRPEGISRCQVVSCVPVMEKVIKSLIFQGSISSINE